LDQTHSAEKSKQTSLQVTFSMKPPLIDGTILWDV